MGPPDFLGMGPPDFLGMDPPNFLGMGPPAGAAFRARRRAFLRTVGLEKRLRPVVPMGRNRVGLLPRNRVVPFRRNQVGPITRNPALTAPRRMKAAHDLVRLMRQPRPA